MISKGRAIREGKCPGCREGHLFKSKPYHRKSFDMHQNCQVCGVPFEREPGFFWGALFVNYALVVAIVLIELTIAYLTGKIRSSFTFWAIPLSVLLLSPPIFQYSRILYLYMIGGIKFEQTSKE